MKIKLTRRSFVGGLAACVAAPLTIFHKPKQNFAAISIPFSKLPTETVIWGKGGLTKEPLRVPPEFLRGRLTPQALTWLKQHKPEVYHRWLKPNGIIDCWFKDGGPRWCLLFDRIRAKASQEFDRQVETDAACMVFDVDPLMAAEMGFFKDQVTRMLCRRTPDPAYYAKKFGIAQGRPEFVAAYQQHLKNEECRLIRSYFVTDVEEKLRDEATESDRNKGFKLALGQLTRDNWNASATEYAPEHDCKLFDEPNRRVCAWACFYRAQYHCYGRLERTHTEGSIKVVDNGNGLMSPTVQIRQDIYHAMRSHPSQTPCFIAGLTYVEIRRFLCRGGLCPYTQGRYLFGPEERTHMANQLRGLKEDMTSWEEPIPDWLDQVIEGIENPMSFPGNVVHVGRNVSKSTTI